MFIRRGFSENYETVGKDCFRHSSFVKELKKDERASDELMAQNSVIRFNSEYMDVLGNWYFLRQRASYFKNNELQNWLRKTYWGKANNNSTLESEINQLNDIINQLNQQAA